MDDGTRRLLSRNIIVYYLLMAFVAFSFFFNEILLVYYRHFGLTYTHISIVTLAGMAVAIVLEVPTGAFADLYGRKRSEIIAVFLMVVSVGLLVTASGFAMFLASSMLLGASMAFHSGSLDAIVYDSLKSLRQEGRFIHVQSKGVGIVIALGMVSAFFGPWAYSIDIRLPFVISALAALVLFFIPFFFFEAPMRRPRVSSIQEHYRQMLRGFSTLWNHQRLLWLTGFVVLFAVANAIIGQLAMAPYILSRGFTVREIGYVALISTALQTLITFSSGRLEKLFGEKWSLRLIAGGVIVVVGAFAAITTRSYVIGICFGFFFGVVGFSQIIISAYTNKHLARKDRATTLSVVSMAGMIAAIPFVLGAGALFDATSLTAGFWALEGLLVVGVIVLYFLRRHRTQVRQKDLS